ncbi:cohesin domain-containing protein [Planctomycetota bacterium]
MKHARFGRHPVHIALLVVALLVSVEASAQPTLTVADVVGQPEDTVTVPVALTSSGDVAQFQFDLHYDDTRFSYVDVQPGISAVMVGKSTTPQLIGAGQLRTIVWGINQNVIPNGEVALVRFAILSGTPPATYTLDAVNEIFSDAGSNPLPGNPSVDGSITVPGAAVPEPGALVLVALGAIGVVARGRRWRRSRLCAG